MKIEVVEDANLFKGLKDDWDKLLEKSRNNSIFMTWEWLYYWWLHFKGDKKLLILLVKNKMNNELLGIAPFCIQKIRLLGIISINKIKFLGTEKVASDFLDFIILPGKEDGVLSNIYEYMNKNSNKWDVIEMEDVDEDSYNMKIFNKNIKNTSNLLIQKAQICPYIKLPENYDLFLKSLSSNLRSNLKRYANQLEEKYRVKYFIENEKAEEYIDNLFILHNKRFNAKKKEKKSAFSGNKIKNFHYDIARSLLLKNRVWFCFIKYHEEMIACLYAFKYKDGLFGYQAGFNPDWHKLGLGSVLFDYVIRNGIEKGLNEFHYLRGDEAYKFKWTKTVKHTLKIILINKNMKSSIYINLINYKMKFKKQLKNIIRIGKDKLSCCRHQP